MIINLTDLIEKVYEIDLKEYEDESKFSFDYAKSKEIYNFDRYCENFKKENPKYKDVGIEVLEEAANIRYRTSYVDAYYKEILEELTSKITKDIKELNKFYQEDTGDSIYTKGKIEVKEIDFSSNDLEITGENEIDKLATIIIDCINGYGMFYYESLEEFYEAYNAVTKNTKIEAVKSHLHWLRYFEDIYGTVHDIFKIDLSNIDDYNTLGNYEFGKDDVENAL